MRVTQPPSSASGQGCPTTHAVASLVAVSSSSAAANMVTRFTLIDAEKRVLAFATRRRVAAALMSHCCVIGSLSMVVTMFTGLGLCFWISTTVRRPLWTQHRTVCESPHASVTVSPQFGHTVARSVTYEPTEPSSVHGSLRLGVQFA